MDSPNSENSEPTKRRLLEAFHRAERQENAKNGSPESASTASSRTHDTDASDGSKRTRFEDAATNDAHSGSDAGAAAALLTLIKTPGQAMKLGDGRQMTVTKVTSAEDIVNKLQSEAAFIDNVIQPQDTQTRDGMLVTFAQTLGLKSEYDYTFRDPHDSVLRLVSDASGRDVIFNVRVEECDDDDEPAAQLIPKG